MIKQIRRIKKRKKNRFFTKKFIFFIYTKNASYFSKKTQKLIIITSFYLFVIIEHLRKTKKNAFSIYLFKSPVAFGYQHSFGQG